MTTIKDIAQHAHCSVSSVSRVLSKQNGVRPELRKQVMQIAEELDYKPLRVHNKRAKHSKILLVVPSPVAISWAISAVMETLKEVSESQQFLYDLQLLDINAQRNFTLDLAKQCLGTHTLATNTKQKIAMILFNVTPSDDAVKFLSDNDIPTVLLQNTHPQLKSILSNEQVGIFESIKYLKGENYKRIFFVGWMPEDFCLKQRYKYFVESCNQFGVKLIADFYCKLDIASSVEVANKLLTKNRLGNNDVVFCAADIIAFGFYEASIDNGIIPGKDFGLMGYDNVDFSQVIGLTTVEQFVPYKLKLAVQYLVEELVQRRGGDYRDIEILLTPKLILRKTT